MLCAPSQCISCMDNLCNVRGAGLVLVRKEAEAGGQWGLLTMELSSNSNAHVCPTKHQPNVRSGAFSTVFANKKTHRIQDCKESVPWMKEVDKARQRDPTLLIQENVVWFYISGKRSKVTARWNLSQMRDANSTTTTKSATFLSTKN